MRKPSAKSLSDLLPAILQPALEQHGLATSQLITRWREIAGDELGHVTRPLRVSWPRGHNDTPQQMVGGTLILQVEPAFALDAQHHAPQILTRINALYGWNAITKMTLRQVPVGHIVPKKAIVPVGAPPELPQVEDGDLRKALQKLGQNVAAPRK